IKGVDARGQRMEARLNSRGEVGEVFVNDRLAAAYTYDANHNLIEASYQTGDAERFSYDDHGRILEYRRLPAGAEARTDQVIRYAYDSQGNLAGVDVDGVGKVSLSSGPQELTGRRGAASLAYRYNGAGQPSLVETPDGSVVRYSYQPGGRLSSVEKSKDGRLARIDLIAPNSVVVQDLMGGKTRYSYAASGALSSVQGTQGELTSYVYDDQGRLREVRLPDGRWTEYRYAASRSQWGTVTVISHAASGQSGPAEPSAPESVGGVGAPSDGSARR